MLSTGNWGGQGLHPRGNVEGFVRAAAKREVARDAWRRPLDPFLHRLRRRDAEAVPRPLPQGRGDRLGPPAQGAVAGPPRRPVRRARRERMAAGAHASGPSSTSTAATGALRRSALSRTRATATPRLLEGVTFLDTPVERRRNRDHRSRRRGSCSCRRRAAMPTSSSSCASSRPNMKEDISRARSIRTRRSRKAGCAPRTASSTRSARALSALPSQTRQGAADARQVVELDVEIWPTSHRRPPGCRIGLPMRGKDYANPGPRGGKLSTLKNEFTGCGPFLHNDPRDRPPEIFSGVTTLHFGGKRQAFMLVPMIPPSEGENARRSSFRDGAKLPGPECTTAATEYASRGSRMWRPGMTTSRGSVDDPVEQVRARPRRASTASPAARRGRSRSPSTSIRMSRCRRRRNSSSRISIQ